MTSELNNRLRIYFNYGSIGFALTLIFGVLTQGLCVPMCGFVLNWILCHKFALHNRVIAIGTIAWITTSIFFGIQYEYQRIQNWSCLFGMSEISENVSYSITLVTFSLLIWETGLTMKQKIKGSFV